MRPGGATCLWDYFGFTELAL